MSLPDRFADGITRHTRVVLVSLLLLTALFGAGMPLLDEDSSLDQFESESPEVEAMEYIDENYVVGEDENTTSVQLIARGDDVLTRDSLLGSLEFQQEIHANASVNETLADEDPITGVENLVAITAITQQEIAEIEQQGAEIEQRQAELNATSDSLEAGIDDARELQREYEQLNETYDEDSETYQNESARIEAGFDAIVEERAEALDLDDEQVVQYEAAIDDAREIESQLYAIERQAEAAGEDPTEVPEYQQLTEQLEDVYAAGTMGVLEDEYAELEAESEALEERQQELEENDERPSLDEQIETLEDLDDDEFEDVLVETLSEGENGDAPALALMPSDYEPGSTEAESRLTSVTQITADQGMEMGAVDDRTVEAQLDLRDLANQDEQEYLVFGGGIITDEIDRSMADSLAIVGPLALLFVVAALLIAYRDLLDIVLGVAGIGAVLVWTFGFMGWTGIAFNQMFVAVPVLLIGLSIDYAIHVFMRHREQRQADGVTGVVRGSMAFALAGVGVALVWVTATTAIGFLANLVSPIAPIREFGVVSAFGILAALLIFGGLIPAAKVELDSWLEGRGIDRRKRAFGTGGSRFSEALTVGSVAARKAPLVLLVVVLLVTAGGVYGASQVDTSFEEEDFLAEEPPAWTEYLPGPMSPGEYQAANDLEYVNENFQREDSQAQILVTGDVTDDETLQRLAAAQDDAAASDVAYTLPTGEADVEGPLSTMESVADRNESFNESFTAADTTGDGVPDENVEALYDELYEVDADAASQVVQRTGDGEYESVRLIVAVQGDAGFDETTDEMRAIAATIDADGDGGGGENSVAVADGAGEGEVYAIATGDPIVGYVVEQDLFSTVIQSLLITLVAVFSFLTVAYRLTGNSATLGAVTLLPVAFATSWILGTMYLVGMPFNVLTGMITSLTIGLGVAYSIHVSARYTLELERQGNVWDAMYTTVTGTGGALLGSAATTVGGFGTLAFAILPVLRQFGIITGLTITYAFLASVLVLPSLLVIWTRYFGPDVSFDRTRAHGRTPAASDGGQAGDSPSAGGENE